MKVMRVASAVLVPVLLVLGLLLSCAPKATPAPPATPEVASAPVKPSWQAKWEQMVAAGRKEGTVSIYSSMGSELRAGVGQALKEKFGIVAEFTSGRAPETTAKILAERQGHVYLADVICSGPDNFLFDLKPARALQPLDPVIILPEVLDKQVWLGGEGLRFIDKEHYVLRMLAYTQPSIVVNTTLVKPGEVTSYRDLLNPKWKGKIVMGDPTIVGTAGTWFRAMALSITGPEYLKELAKQEPFILRDDRLLGEWLAKGKYPLGLGLKSDVVSEFMRVGAPLQNVVPAEGAAVITGGGCLVLMNNAPHPNAAAVFINWLLTKEGQTLRSRIERTQSARLDVPTEHLDPGWVRDPNIKYFDGDDEKVLMEAANARKLAKDIFGPLMAK